MQRITLCVFLLFVACSVARDIRTNVYTQFYQSLPENLKIPFVQYQLAAGVLADNEMSRMKILPIDESLKSPEGLGISKDVFEDIEELDPPSGFTENLYQLTKETFDLNRLQIMVLAKGKEWCFGQSKERKDCYDIGDPAANCC